MEKRPVTAISGFGIGLFMWVLEVAEVKLPIPLLVFWGIVAFGMVIYGSIPISVLVLNRVRKLRIRSPIMLATSVSLQQLLSHEGGNH